MIGRDRPPQPAKIFQSPHLGVDLHRIHQRQNRRHHRIRRRHIGSRRNLLNGANRQASPTAVAAVIENPPIPIRAMIKHDRLGRTYPLTGATTIRRTPIWIKRRLPKMGIFPIVQTGHQQRRPLHPRGDRPKLFLPDPRRLQSLPCCCNHRRVCGHINAISPYQCIGQCQVSHIRKGLKASTTNQLKPMPLFKGAEGADGIGYPSGVQ